MNIDIFLIKLLILFFPGIISLVLIQYLSITRSISNFIFALYSFSLGLINYLLVEFFFFLCKSVRSLYKNLDFPEFNTSLKMWDSFTGKKDNISVVLPEIFYAALAALITGIIISYFIQHKYLLKFFKLKFFNKLQITDKNGDDDIWSHFLNNKTAIYVYIRDIENKLTYYGSIESFSNMNQPREILLTDVSIYELKSGEFMYDVPLLYLPLEHKNFRIELARN